MKHLIASAEQAWKNGLERLELWKAERARETDDTVESQAKMFRIWVWSSAAALVFIGLIAVKSKSHGTSTGGAESQPASADKDVSQSIPDGYVLVPIEPTNIDALDSLFDSHGYADLYTPDTGSDENSPVRGTKKRLIRRGVPLLRAPRNPRRFAALIEEGDQIALAKLAEPVIVVVRKGRPKPNDAAESSRHHGKKSPVVKIEVIQEPTTEIR